MSRCATEIFSVFSIVWVLATVCVCASGNHYVKKPDDKVSNPIGKYGGNTKRREGNNLSSRSTEKANKPVVLCNYLSTKICHYTLPEVCNGSEELRPTASSVNSSNCRAVRRPGNCDLSECDRDCDERSTPWSKWSACPSCVMVGAQRPPLSIRERRITKEGLVYCVIKQGRICEDLRICKGGGEDDYGTNEPYSTNASDKVESKYLGAPEITSKCQYGLSKGRCNMTIECSSYEEIVPKVDDPDCPYWLTWIECLEEECEASCLILSGPWSPWTPCSASCDEKSVGKLLPRKERQRTAAETCAIRQTVECLSLPICPQKQQDPSKDSKFIDVGLLIYLLIILCIVQYFVAH